jgi:hypothetical protein
MPSRLTRRGPLLAAFALYFCGIAAAFYWCTDWTARQTYAVVLTGLAIIWYTWETKLLRHATLAQRELQLRPLVVLELKKEGGFWAHNVGYGPALNVSVDEVTIDQTEEVVVRFPAAICILEAGKSAHVVAESFKKGKPADDFFLAHLDPQYANRDLRLRVTFQNAEMRPYSVTESVRPQVLSVVEVSSSEAL